MPEWLISVIVLGLVGAIVLLVHWLRRSTQAAQQRAYAGLKIHAAPAWGTVPVVFHTYYGFLVYVIQTEHRFWASPEDARVALWRLHRFNLVWGHVRVWSVGHPPALLRELPRAEAVDRPAGRA